MPVENSRSCSSDQDNYLYETPRHSRLATDPIKGLPKCRATTRRKGSSLSEKGRGETSTSTNRHTTSVAPQRDGNTHNNGKRETAKARDGEVCAQARETQLGTKGGNTLKKHCQKKTKGAVTTARRLQIRRVTQKNTEKRRSV